MTDKGFSSYIREIVGEMLNPDRSLRPDTLTLVHKIEEGLRSWRANTEEGMQYVDPRDVDRKLLLPSAGLRKTKGALIGL
jgi:hypothetical protein